MKRGDSCFLVVLLPSISETYTQDHCNIVKKGPGLPSGGAGEIPQSHWTLVPAIDGLEQVYYYNINKTKKPQESESCSEHPIIYGFTYFLTKKAILKVPW